MNQFIKKIFLFVIILIVIDKAFIVFRSNETNLFSEVAQKKMHLVSANYSAPKAFDILITGSSHAQFAVSPEMIFAETGSTCLNIAFGGGANMGLQLTLLKNILRKEKRFHPNMILFGMDVFTMNAPPVFFDETLDILIQQRTGFEKILDSKLLYSYCRLYAPGIPAYVSDIKKGNWQLPLFSTRQRYQLNMFSHFEKTVVSELGWVKGYGTLNRSFLRYANITFRPDAHAEESLQEYIKLCADHHIRLILFQTPEHIACFDYQQKYEDFNAYFQKRSVKDGFTFLNYNTTQLYPIAKDSLFFDTDHLNFQGAELFTHTLIKDLGHYQKPKN